MKLGFSGQIFVKSSSIILHEIHLAGAELFHADRQKKNDTYYRVNDRFPQACERAENALAYSPVCSLKQNLPVGSSALCVTAYFVVVSNCRLPGMTLDTSEMHMACAPFLHTLLLWLRWFGSPLAAKHCFQ